MLLSAGLTLFYSCSKSAQTLEDRLSRADEKIAALEELSARISQDISGLAVILEEAQAGNLILKCEPTPDGNGYIISFSDGQVISVSNGEDGIDGTDGTDSDKDGHTPEISVKKDHTGAWCWTIDGEFLTDSDGNHIHVSIDAQQGRDGAVPMFRVLDGKWQVSYTGGEVWLDLCDSAKGSPYLFKAIEIDGALVTFTLSDGTQFELFRLVDPLLSISGWEGLPVVPNRSIEVDYTVDGATPYTKVSAVANSGLAASVLAGDTVAAGKIRIDVPSILTDADVLVCADNGYGRISMKKISFKQGTILVSDIESIEDMDPFTW